MRPWYKTHCQLCFLESHPARSRRVPVQQVIVHREATVAATAAITIIPTRLVAEAVIVEVHLARAARLVAVDLVAAYQAQRREERREVSRRSAAVDLVDAAVVAAAEDDKSALDRTHFPS